LKPHGGNPIKSITLEDVQKLLAEAETQGYQVMVLPPPEKPPQNQIGGVVGSSPATGKRLIAKSTQSQLYSELLDHDHSPTEIEQQPNGLIPENQILNDLYQDLNQDESSILLNQAPIIATESNFTGEILGEFNLPVSTQIVNENSQNLQSLVLDSLDGVQGLDQQAAFDQYGQNVSLLTKFDQKVGQEDHCWSGTSLFLDGQPQEDEATLAHIDPTLVTGQAMPVSEININETTTLTTDMSDLERYVMDPSIAPDSQEFETFVAVDNPTVTLDLTNFPNSVVGPSTSGSAISSSGNQVQPLPVKRGRGRPRLIKTEPDPPKRPRGRPATAPEYAQVDAYDSSYSSNDMSEDAKQYRRMRDLNNAASKRCRVGRKRKSEEDEEEAFELGVRNLELKSQVESLESQVKEFKALVFQMIKKQKGSTISTPAKFPKVSQVQTSLNSIGQVQTTLNKSARVQATFNKMRQVQTCSNPKTLAASISYHDPSDLSFLDNVTL